MRPEFVARTLRAYLLIAGFTFCLVLLLSASRFTGMVENGGIILALAFVIYVPIQAWLYRTCRIQAEAPGADEWFRRTAFWVLVRDSLFLCVLCWTSGTFKSHSAMLLLVPILVGILLLDRSRIRLIAVITSLTLTAIVLLETFEIIPHVEWTLDLVDYRKNRWNALTAIATFVGSIFVVYSVALAVLDELADKRRELESIASRDMLTGLYNRRVFEISAVRELERSVRTGNSVTFVLVDVDHFKTVNDTRGHAAGDAVLKTVSGVFESSLRRGMDMAFRFGGDEFVLLLTDTDVQGTSVLLGRILDRVRQARFESGGDTFGVTLSVGAFTINTRDVLADLDYCLERADQCLYRAKRAGRDNMVIEAAEAGPV